MAIDHHIVTKSWEAVLYLSQCYTKLATAFTPSSVCRVLRDMCIYFYIYVYIDADKHTLWYIDV